MSQSEKKTKTIEKQVTTLKKGYQAILEFIDEMEELIQFQDRIDIPTDIDQIWEALLDEIQKTISVDVCGLFMVDEDTHEFVLQNVSPRDKGTICKKEIAYQVECGTFSWIINRRQPALIPSLVFKNKKTIIMLPLSTTKRTLGAVLILTPIEESSITHKNLKLLKILSRQCSLMMENALLYKRLKNEHTNLKTAQARIIQAEKMASIGRLTYGASHEILNPLNIISGHIQLLLMGGDTDSRTSNSLNIMREQTERISKIIKSLLLFFHYGEPKIGSIDINELIEKVMSMVTYEAKHQGIRIVTDLEKNLQPVMGDNDKLSQVLLHLISNSKDAMPDGGLLKISTRVLPDNSRSNRKQKSIEIKCEDTGSGIPEEEVDKIFDPFYTDKEVGKGPGLGLSICYGIVQEHGGSINVESELNKGTTFFIHLPTASEQKPNVKNRGDKIKKTPKVT